MFGFHVTKTDSESEARLGRLSTFHGEVETPVFMAVGTQGTVKGLTPQQLRDAGVNMVLGNTYHLMLRPGSELIAELGGLHKFMGWDGPILTDSGGFQVFSLADLSKKTNKGVAFRSHIDGSQHWLDPEHSMKVQRDLGSDVVMAFDDCTTFPSTYQQTRASMELTHAWAKRSLDAFKGDRQALFGIVQGGMFEDLRSISAEVICEMPFHGIAIGGLSVGESKEDMYRVLSHTAALLPSDKPHYLMGVGTPADLVNAVSVGVDMFDCVMPTRNARNANAFTSRGSVSIKQARYRTDEQPLDPDCGCYTCTHFSRAYLHHLYKAKEILSPVLMTLHNLTYYQDLMKGVRDAIREGRFTAFQRDVLRTYGAQEIHNLSEAS
ncbi:MAG: tRNA guanosine(34) transglycosylase Tgt [Acidobacteriota bacterium]|nr:tRNA guanosine(34) transglycosylase Tgt [Acidobacteriota bacterium]